MPQEKFRKYQLTFNNPLEHNFSHEKINETMKEISWNYYCLCDEIGENGTPHTHLFFNCENAVSFDRIKKLFPTAHIEQAKGTCQSNRDYIRKEGKYLHSDKKETNIIETFEEYGIMPIDKAEKNKNTSEQVFEMVKSGNSNIDVIDKFPSYATKIHHLETLRQEILKEEFSDKTRFVEVFYIFGEAGTGKTRFVMENFGYKNVCKVSDYKNPFDNYKGQDILLLDEFRSQIDFSELLQITDIYPCDLHARYSNRPACYTKIYIVSNIDLKRQYVDIQNNDPKSWNALIRRIDVVYRFDKDGKFIIPTDDYIIEG